MEGLFLTLDWHFRGEKSSVVPGWWPVGFRFFPCSILTLNILGSWTWSGLDWSGLGTWESGIGLGLDNYSTSQRLSHKWLISSHHEGSMQNCSHLRSDLVFVFISRFVCCDDCVCPDMRLAPGHRWSLAIFSHSTILSPCYIISTLSSLAMSRNSLARTNYFMMCDCACLKFD